MANNNRRGGYGFSYSPRSLTGPGTIFTLGFIALAIGFGIMLSKGIAPQPMLSDVDPTEEYEMIPLTPDPSQKGLQLKTVKFKSCASSVTIDLMLDRSGSMSEITPTGQQKLQRLKEAVNALVEGSNDNTIIGIQSFDSTSITNDVPVGLYKDIKSQIPAALEKMEPGGKTPTHDALLFSYNILKDEVPKYPNRKFNFIFISDGQPVPNEQDPFLPIHNPNPVTQIKALKDVTVYTVGIFSANQTNPALASLLKNIATSPAHYFASATGDDVKILLKQISTKICNEQIPT